MLQFLVSASDHLNRNHRMRRDQMAPKRAARSVMSAASTRWRAQRSFSQLKGTCVTCVPQCNLNGRVLRFVNRISVSLSLFLFQRAVDLLVLFSACGWRVRRHVVEDPPPAPRARRHCAFADQSRERWVSLRAALMLLLGSVARLSCRRSLEQVVGWAELRPWCDGKLQCERLR